MKACFSGYLTLTLRARGGFTLTFAQPLVYLALFGPPVMGWRWACDGAVRTGPAW